MSYSLDCSLKTTMPSGNCQTLPDDLIREIFSWLPASSIVRFKYLSKSCNSFIQSKQFIKLQLHRTVENINETRRWRVLMSNFLNSSWSIGVAGVDKLVSQVGHVMDRSVSEAALMQMDICNGIYMSWVIGSCNGLFCIYMTEISTIFVWNPCTFVHKFIPSNGQYYPSNSIWTVLGFGNDGTASATDGFKIVRLNKPYNSSEDNNYAHQSTVEISIFTLGGSGWRINEEKVPLMNLLGNGLYFKGALHWVNGLTVMPTGVKRGIVVFSLGKEMFEQVMPLPEYDDDMQLKRFRLRVVCGKLTAFYCSPYSSGFEIWVMERYGVKESWTKKISITDLKYSAFVQPISFLRDDSLLLNIDNEKVIVYDPKNRTYNTIESLSLPLPSYRTSIIEYVESLVPPICDAEVK